MAFLGTAGQTTFLTYIIIILQQREKRWHTYKYGKFDKYVNFNETCTREESETKIILIMI